MILLIDTATKICSVSIAQEGKVIATREDIEGFNHASKLTLLIQEVCAEANLILANIHAVAVSIGPGSYTGLRIGLSTAKGICYAIDKPLIVIDTLEALFSASRLSTNFENALFVPMIDARRMEVYTVFYNHRGDIIHDKQALEVDENSFNHWLNEYDQLVLSGDGAEKFKSILTSERFYYTNLRCSAEHLAPLAFAAFQKEQFADLAYIEPTYFKPPNITKPKNQI